MKLEKPLILIILLHLCLAAAYAGLIPLGEAPDEPAHLRYVQFIAKNKNLPTSLAEREEAGYRSPWPPLYHFLAAGPMLAVGDTPPTRLKSVGDSARRLIPTNGQTIAAFLHTTDESWPWRGLPLAWHLGRLVSVGLTALAVIVTYLIAWRLTHRRGLALSAAALHAFLPQVLFVSGALNDDNLLILLAGLIFLTLLHYSRQNRRPTLKQTGGLGLLLGLASVAKYNALPLWGFVPLWLGWLVLRGTGRGEWGAATRALLTRLAALLAGAALTLGWWFAFVWIHFNQVDTQGWLGGTLAALSAGSSGVSGQTMQQLGGGLALSMPAPRLWLAWLAALFTSFWGQFGGGGAIELPGWAYGLLAALNVAALLGALGAGWALIQRRCKVSSEAVFAALFPLFFLILPLLRFFISNTTITETAQGRHLFPALATLTLGLVWGLSRAGQAIGRRGVGLSVLPLAGLLLSVLALPLIRAAYPPPLPVTTTGQAGPLAQPLNVALTDSITLLGWEGGQADNGALPVSLVWRAEQIPPEDYLIKLSLTGADGQSAGGWLGQPVGGRYPSRAWDDGDIVRDVIPVPLLPGAAAKTASLSLTLLNQSGQSVAGPLPLAEGLALPPGSKTAQNPGRLRADGLPPDAAFAYRATISLSQPEPTTPALIDPTGQRLSPDLALNGEQGGLAQFIVKADWPAGQYQVEGDTTTVTVSNRPRQFAPPPLQYQVEANFADTLTLLGYDLPRRRVEAGQSFPITLHWRAEQTTGQNLVVFNHLLDEQAVQRGGADRIPKKYYTTLLWVPDEIVSDEYEVPVSGAAPPGIYWLDVGLYPADQPGRSLPLVVEGQAIDQSGVRLGPVKVGGPPPGVVLSQVEPQQPRDIQFGEIFTLLGFDVNQTGSELNLTLYWRAEAAPPVDYTVFVHSLDEADAVIAQADGPPAGGRYPTSLWEAGEIVRSEHRLADLPPGAYRLLVGLYQADSGARLPVGSHPDGAVALLEFSVEK